MYGEAVNLHQTLKVISFDGVVSLELITWEGHFRRKSSQYDYATDQKAPYHSQPRYLWLDLHTVIKLSEIF